jgi:hypothetical protein
MSPFDMDPGPPRRVGFSPASGSPDIKWIRPGTPAYPPSPMPRSSMRERTEQTNAMIVIVLTLACTALSLYDLFLLASGS